MKYIKTYESFSINENTENQLDKKDLEKLKAEVEKGGGPLKWFKEHANERATFTSSTLKDSFHNPKEIKLDVDTFSKIFPDVKVEELKKIQQEADHNRQDLYHEYGR